MDYNVSGYFSLISGQSQFNNPFLLKPSHSPSSPSTFTLAANYNYVYVFQGPSRRLITEYTFTSANIRAAPFHFPAHFSFRPFS